MRGYNLSTPFTITLTNANDSLEIAEVREPSANFNISLFLSDTYDTTPKLLMNVISSIDGAQLTKGIGPNESIVVTGEALVLIPRDTCSLLHYLCIEVHPGAAASYSTKDGGTIVVCLSISAYKNCHGECSHYFHLYALCIEFTSILSNCVAITKSPLGTSTLYASPQK